MKDLSFNSSSVTLIFLVLSSKSFVYYTSIHKVVHCSILFTLLLEVARRCIWWVFHWGFWGLVLFCRARKPKKHKVLHKESSGCLKTTVYSKMSEQLLWRLSHIFLCFFLIVISNDYLILKNVLILQNVFLQWNRAPYKLSDSISLYNSDYSTD